MPDDFGCYDEEVERRIKMSRPVNKRPKIKTPKPFATLTIVGNIADPENLAKIQAAYDKEALREAQLLCHKPPAPSESNYKPVTSLQKKITEFFDEYVDEETELTREIAEAAKKAGIPTEGLNIPKPPPPKNVQIMSGTGWLGPG